MPKYRLMYVANRFSAHQILGPRYQEFDAPDDGAAVSEVANILHPNLRLVVPDEELALPVARELVRIEQESEVVIQRW